MINIKRLFIATVLFTFFFISNVMSQKKNQLDASGKRTGAWEKRYPSGKLRYTGTFNNGIEVGVFKFYKNSSNNFPHIIKEYTEGSRKAFVKFYNLDGVVKTKGEMMGKKRVGAWTYYYTNGKLFSEEIYVEGKLEGLLKNYYSNGNITEETFYKNGLKDGTSKIYTENAILIEEVIYVNGKLEGPGKYYDLKGKIKEKGVFKDNKRVGKWDFYMDGEVSDKPKRKGHSVDRGE